MRLQICENDFCNCEKVKNKLCGKLPGMDVLAEKIYYL